MIQCEGRRCELTTTNGGPTGAAPDGRRCDRERPLVSANVGQTKTMTDMTYEEKMYGIVIVRPDHDRRLFGRIRRSSKGDVYAIWSEGQSPDNLRQSWNPHASYHYQGQFHSKSHDRRTVVRNLQPLNRSFVGNQPIEATNADRGASTTLPPVPDHLDDQFEISFDAISGGKNRAITVDIVEPGIAPIRLTGHDTVIAEKVFKDDVPWIVVSLVEVPTMI